MRGFLFIWCIKVILLCVNLFICAFFICVVFFIWYIKVIILCVNLFICVNIFICVIFFIWYIKVIILCVNLFICVVSFIWWWHPHSLAGIKCQLSGATVIWVRMSLLARLHGGHFSLLIHRCRWDSAQEFSAQGRITPKQTSISFFKKRDGV